MQFWFDDYRLDTERRELHRGATPVAVEPQVFDLLVYLLRNRNRVVTKDDLVASVWGGGIVSASTLASRINAARRAVGDDGEAQRLIRTVSRRGARFIGEAGATRSPPRRLRRQPYRLVVVASDELGIAGDADVMSSGSTFSKARAARAWTEPRCRVGRTCARRRGSRS